MKDELINKIFPQNCGDFVLVLEKIDKGEYKNKYKVQFQKYPYIDYRTKQDILNRKCLNPEIERIEFIEKLWPQNCGDSLRIIEKSDKKNNSSYLWKCEFIKYPYIVFCSKYDIKHGIVINPRIEEEEFIKKEWPQNCGDIIKIIEKTNLQNKDKKFLFRGFFLKYPYEILATKQNILNKNVLNPQIEVVEFMQKEWPQHCGDTLRILEPIIKKDSNGWNKTLYKCEFQKYPYIIIKSKSDIVKGFCLNPRIEEEEFIKKLWPQSYGEFIKILKKTNVYKKGTNSLLYKVQFQKYPYIDYRTKQDILAGYCINPEIEKKNFVKKEWLQYCGDSLRIIKKIEEGPNKGKFECEFQKYPYKIIAKKSHIIRGYIFNPNLPWNNKKLFLKFLKSLSFKPTIEYLAIFFKLSINTIRKKINQYNLQDYLLIETKEFIFYSNIKKLYDNEIFFNNNILKKYEIDVYLPKLKIGFEFNGNYWHSSLFKENCYHKNKTIFAKEKNIQLFHIWEWEWDLHKEIILDFIKRKIKKEEYIINSEHCEIREIKKYQDYAQFCNENHLQGECGARVKLGLYYKDELIQVMSFGSPRFTSEYEWEIIRECSKNNYKILNGKYKIFNYFIINYKPNSVCIYRDYSKFTGKSYEKLGFELKNISYPGYIYCEEGTSNIFYRREKINNKRLFKIYNCGQLLFVWKNKIPNGVS